MRFVLFLFGAVAAALAVATMMPAELALETRLGVCAAAGLGAPALAVLWTWVQLRGRPRLRKIAPWAIGLAVQGLCVAVPTLYGKQPDDAVAVVKTIVKKNLVGTSSVAAITPIADPPVQWRAKWVAAIDGPGLEVVRSVYVDRPRARVIVAGQTLDRSKNTVFVTARSLHDGSELWMQRFAVDESGTPYVTRVEDGGAVHVVVGLTGVLTLPDGRELGARTRQRSVWSLRITPSDVESTSVHSVLSVAVQGGDLVRNGLQTIERVGPDGTVRWSVSTKRMAYELSVVRGQVHAYGTLRGKGGGAPERSERLRIDLATGAVVDRGPWFRTDRGHLRVAMSAAPGADAFWTVMLPPQNEAPILRPDGTTLERTGDSEVLVERIDERFAPRWSRSFSNRSVRVPVAPIVLPSGSVLVAGWFATPVDFGDGPVEPIGRSDLFLVELDPNDGKTRATQRLGGSGAERLEAVTFDDGALVVAGGFQDALLFGKKQLTAQPRDGDVHARREGFVALFEASPLGVPRP